MTGDATVTTSPRPQAAPADADTSPLANLARAEALSGRRYEAARAYLGWREAVPAEALNAALSALAERCRAEDIVSAEELSACLDRLGAASAPDLVTEFCDPLIGRAICRLAGLDASGADAAGQLAGALAALEGEKLSGRAARQAEKALAGAAGLMRDGAPRPAALAALPPEMPEGMALALLAAAIHASAQPLAAVIWGLVISGHDFWCETSGPDWAEEGFAPLYDRVMTLFRRDPAETEGAPALARIGDDGPLAVHVRELVRRAIPALAGRFPRLYLQRNHVRFLGSRALIAPSLLPAGVRGESAATSSFIFEIREVGLAREIATDKDRFAPQRVAEFFARVQAETGTDMHATVQLAGNALFFMVGPRHQRSRKVTMDVLGQNRLKVWQPVIDRGVDAALGQLAAAAEPDIVRDFTEPVLRNVCKPILGLNPVNDERFDSVALTLASLQSPMRSLKAMVALEAAVRDMMEMIETQPSDDRPGDPRSVLSLLLEADLEEFDRRDLVAFVLVLYSGCFNIAHTLANAICWISLLPKEMTEGIADPRWTRERIEHIMSTCTSIKFIRRAAQSDFSLGGFDFTPEHEARINIAAVNQGIAAGNMTFGHGLRRCVGAALARLVVRAAIPKLYSRFPELKVLPQALTFMDLPTAVSLEELKCRLHAP